MSREQSRRSERKQERSQRRKEKKDLRKIKIREKMKIFRLKIIFWIISIFVSMLITSVLIDNMKREFMTNLELTAIIVFLFFFLIINGFLRFAHFLFKAKIKRNSKKEIRRSKYGKEKTKR